MTTLADVVDAAGVSKATASLVLSGRYAGRVSEKKAEHVRRVSEQLGYVGNALAGAMRNGQTTTIGVIAEEVLSTPYAVSMVDSVLNTAQELGWSVLLTDSGRHRSGVESAVREMRSRRVQHVIFASMYHRELEIPAGFREAVVLNGFAGNMEIPAAVPDETQGARDAVEHLLNLGHRRIAFIGHDEPSVIAMRLRQQAYEECLRKAGIAVDPSLILAGGNDPDSADQLARKLLDRSDRPTAVFCYNDGLAAGIYRQAYRLGLSIPEDLSVVGFDDLLLISTNLDPGLTTMQLPHREMAAWLTRALAEGRVEELPTLTTFACPLIERASTAPPRRR